LVGKKREQSLNYGLIHQRRKQEEMVRTVFLDQWMKRSMMLWKFVEQTMWKFQLRVQGENLGGQRLETMTTTKGEKIIKGIRENCPGTRVKLRRRGAAELSLFGNATRGNHLEKSSTSRQNHKKRKGEPVLGGIRTKTGFIYGGQTCIAILNQITGTAL